MYFNSPPVLISGVFIIDSTPAYEAYKGGLAITMQPYSMLAVGEYQHTYSSDLKSVFIFGRFDGPLLTLEFAEISGVEVGMCTRQITLWNFSANRLYRLWYSNPH